MNAITDADREAATALREHLADLAGFWFKPGDDGPLVQALARHRVEAEQRLAEKLSPFIKHPEAPARAAKPLGESPPLAQQRRVAGPYL